MTLRKGFGAELALPHGNDVRYDLAGTVARSAAGVVRGGMFPPLNGATLLTPSATMAVNVAAFSGCGVRDGGPVFLANDGASTVTPGAAPTSNSRLDVLYAIQHDASSFVVAPDSDNLPTFGVLAGIAAPTPVRNPAGLPAGALELGTIQIPSTATNSGSAGVVITPTFLYTAMAGGVITFRTTTEMNAFTPVDGQRAYCIADTLDYVYTSGAWKQSHLVNDTGWVAMTLANSWVNWGAPYATAQYRRKNGVTYMTGLIKSGTTTLGTALTTLPAGFRPANSISLPSVANGTSLGSLQVDSTGVVSIIAGGSVAASGGLTLTTQFVAEV